MWKYLLWIGLSLGLVIGFSAYDEGAGGEGFEPPAQGVSFRCCAPPPDCIQCGD